MHGRKKLDSSTLDEAKRLALKKKIDAYKATTDGVLSLRSSADYSPEALARSR
jgi:hypothetical protein